jgi:outer membrane protein
VAGWALKAARRDRGPVLNAFGSSDWDSEGLSDTERSYTVGLALEWEWFSGFEKGARVDEARQLLQAAEAGREQVRRELALDRRQATLALEEAWARLQVTSQAVGSAEEALRITRAQYTEGAAEISVLLVAELGLTETRMRDTAAMYDYQIAKSNLARATGVLATRY